MYIASSRQQFVNAIIEDRRMNDDWLSDNKIKDNFDLKLNYVVMINLKGKVLQSGIQCISVVIRLF